MYFSYIKETIKRFLSYKTCLNENSLNSSNIMVSKTWKTLRAEAWRPPFVHYLSPGFVGWQFGKPFIHFIGYVLHEPFEIFTLVFLFELELLTDVSDGVPPDTGLPSVEELPVLSVKPNFYHSHVILSTESIKTCTNTGTKIDHSHVILSTESIKTCTNTGS